MINYEPGTWGVSVIFKLRGSVFPKAMVWALPCTIVAAVLHHVLHQPNSWISLGIGESTFGTTVFGGFNFILGFLVVFRSQQAYARWWEGGTLLQQLRGEWFNSFSCLIAFSNAAEERRDEVAHFQQQLVRLYSLLYGCALTQVSCMAMNSFDLINLDGFDEESLQFLQGVHDKCEVTLQWIQRLIVEAEQKQIIKIAPPILSRVYNELGNGIVNLNNARKIKEFPIPLPLAQMIMVMLIVHAVFTPLICAATLATPTWAALLTFVVILSFWGVLYISLELEMPFGDDPNDLPLAKMAEDLNDSLRTLLEPRSSAVPKFVMPTGKQLSLHGRTVDFDNDIGSGRSTYLRKSTTAPNLGAVRQKSADSRDLPWNSRAPAVAQRRKSDTDMLALHSSRDGRTSDTLDSQSAGIVQDLCRTTVNQDSLPPRPPPPPPPPRLPPPLEVKNDGDRIPLAAPWQDPHRQISPSAHPHTVTIPEISKYPPDRPPLDNHQRISTSTTTGGLPSPVGSEPPPPPEDHQWDQSRSPGFAHSSMHLQELRPHSSQQPELRPDIPRPVENA